MSEFKGQQILNLLPFSVSLFLTMPLIFNPFAAVGGEWINGDQQGELFERSEFSPCRRSSFRHREPA
jgi:hypothetical protein